MRLVRAAIIRTCVWASAYLYSHLELFMLPLQLLGLRQRAGVHHAGIQHGLTITDPTQHLEETDRENQDCETTQGKTANQKVLLQSLMGSSSSSSSSSHSWMSELHCVEWCVHRVWHLEGRFHIHCWKWKVSWIWVICDITHSLESNRVPCSAGKGVI